MIFCLPQSISRERSNITPRSWKRALGGGVMRKPSLSPFSRRLTLFYDVYRSFVNNRLTQVYQPQAAADTHSTNVNSISIINKLESDVTDNLTGSNIMTRILVSFVFCLSRPFCDLKYLFRSMLLYSIRSVCQKLSLRYDIFLKSKTDFALRTFTSKTVTCFERVKF